MKETLIILSLFFLFCINAIAQTKEDVSKISFSIHEMDDEQDASKIGFCIADLDEDGIRDSLTYNLENTSLVFLLSTHGFEPFFVIYENIGDRTTITASKGWFGITASHMRAVNDENFIYDSDKKQFRLAFISHENYGNAQNDGSGRYSLDLLENKFEGYMSFYDLDKEELVSSPTVSLHVDNAPVYLDDEEWIIHMPEEDFFRKYMENSTLQYTDTFQLNAQNTMKIPLSEGYENQPVQIKNTTVNVARLYIIREKHNTELSVELNISENDEQYNTSFFYLYTDDRPKSNVPKAFGKYLLGLEINDNIPKPEVFLTIEQNDFGKPFILDLNQEAVIDSLTIRFDSAIGEWSMYAPDEPAFCDTEIQFSLSENNVQKNFKFMDAYEFQTKGTLLFEWKSYRVWVLGCSETTMLLKVEKHAQGRDKCANTLTNRWV